MNASRQLIRAVARHGLPTPHEPDDGLPARALDDGSWSALLDECHRQRLVGHLCATVTDGALPATEAQHHEVVAWDLRVLAHRQHLDVALAGAVAHLSGSAIDHRVLKGSALAHAAYPDPNRRQHYDNDLLAPPDRFEDAIAALLAAGYRRRMPPPRRGYDGRFAKSVTLIGPDGYELDLHRTIIDGPFGLLIDLNDLWARHATVEVAGAILRCLPAEEQLLHACTSASLSDVPPRWSALRDVAQLLQADHADASRFLAIAGAHHFGVVASSGLVLAAQQLEFGAHHQLLRWAASYEPSRAERRRLRVYRDRRTFAHQSLESLRVVRGLRGRAAYAHAVLLPSAEFLAAFETTRMGWLRRGQRSLRRTPD